jgi:hypothetical protein
VLYFSYIYSIITYDIIFWGNSPYSIKIFKIQKIIRNTTNLTETDLCRIISKTMKILPIYSQYIINTKHLFISNQEIHNINTRPKFKFHIPHSSVTKYQKGVNHWGIKLFDHLPTLVRSLSNHINLLKKMLKEFLHDDSFYFAEKYFDFHGDWFQLNETRFNFGFVLLRFFPNVYKLELIITLYSLLIFYGSFVVIESDNNIVYMKFALERFHFQFWMHFVDPYKMSPSDTLYGSTKCRIM